MITGVGDRSTRRVHSARVGPVPNWRSFARPTTLARVTALPPPYFVPRPARPERPTVLAELFGRATHQTRVSGCILSDPPRCRPEAGLPTRSHHSSTAQTTHITPSCHFPAPGQMVG